MCWTFSLAVLEVKKEYSERVPRDTGDYRGQYPRYVIFHPKFLDTKMVADTVGAGHPLSKHWWFRGAPDIFLEITAGMGNAQAEGISPALLRCPLRLGGGNE